MLSYLVAFGLIAGGYYYFTKMRSGVPGAGGGSVAAYGLDPDEGIAAMFNASLDKNLSGAAQFFASSDYDSVTVTLSTRGRLVVSQPGRAFTPVAFAATNKPRIQIAGDVLETGGKPHLMAGQSGLEPAKVVNVSPATGSPLRLLLAASAAKTISDWAATA